MPPKRKRAATSGEGLPEAPDVQAEEVISIDADRATPKDRKTRVNGAFSPAAARQRNVDNISTPTTNRVLPINLTAHNPTTPQKVSTPRRNAVDRSARRKSNQRRLELAIAAEGTEDEEEGLVDKIGGDDAVDGEENEEEDAAGETDDQAQGLDSVELPGETPVKRGRGRPKGSKNREITPPTDLPPYEWYFWINRPNGLKTSTNTFPSSAFLDHSAYFESLQKYNDPHIENIQQLYRHHEQDFGFWEVELNEGFNILLHGYGNKLGLLKGWANWLHARHEAARPRSSNAKSTPSKSRQKHKNASAEAIENGPSAIESPITIILDANHSALTTRSLWSTIASAALPSDTARDMPNQATDAVRFLIAQLESTSSATSPHIYLLINPIHAPLLTHAPMPTLLAELSQQPRLHIIATADDPHFALLWPQGLKDQYNWVFHDGSTFGSYDDGQGQVAGAGVVDTVNELLGRKGARGKGREGVRWVLRSLPESARQVYRILVAEILSAEGDAALDIDFDMDEVLPEDGDDEMGGLEDDGLGNGPADARNRGPGRSGNDELPAISYKMLYSKAVEEFLTSSEMGFRGLLKEFVDHQMVVIKRDMSGQEAIGIDMRRDELTGVLEDLLLAE